MATNGINAKDLARVQKIAEFIHSNQEDVLLKAYETAVAAGEEQSAEEAARKYRNKLLDECDNMLVSDRPNVDVEAWKAYRQALRDVPEQEGFPFVINFPVKPE